MFKSSDFTYHSYYCPYFGVIQSKCGKIRTRITLNTDTFHTVYIKAWMRATSLQTNSMIRNLPRILIRFSINSYNFEDVKNTPITA